MKGLTRLDRNLQLDDEMSIDIRYADDTTLVSAIFEKLQIATSELENACHKWGLNINPLKCAVLTTENNDIKIGNNIVPKVNQFKILGSFVPNCPDDIMQRISMASQAFGRLRETIWTSRDVSKKLKILQSPNFSNSNIQVRDMDNEAKIDQFPAGFRNEVFKSYLRVTSSDRLSNIAIRKSLNVVETIEEVIVKRQLSWFGHEAEI